MLKCLNITANEGPAQLELSVEPMLYVIKWISIEPTFIEPLAVVNYSWDWTNSIIPMLKYYVVIRGFSDLGLVAAKYRNVLRMC